MKINLDGTFYLDKGEYVPFLCPKCKWPIEYDSKVLMVNCFHCGYIGDIEEFSPDYKLTKRKDEK